MSREKETIREQILSIERELFGLRCRLDGFAKEVASGDIPLLEISVADTWHAIILTPVKEVIPVVRCDSLPGAPEWMLGTFRYGEEIVPVVDTACRLSGDRTTIRPEHKIVLVDALHLTGLLVSDTGDITTIRRDQIVPPASGVPHADYVIGAFPDAAGTSISLLSVESLSREVVTEAVQDG